MERKVKDLCSGMEEEEDWYLDFVILEYKRNLNLFGIFKTHVPDILRSHPGATI